jgi:hypothetical protein
MRDPMCIIVQVDSIITLLRQQEWYVLRLDVLMLAVSVVKRLQLVYHSKSKVKGVTSMRPYSESRRG